MTFDTETVGTPGLSQANTHNGVELGRQDTTGIGRHVKGHWLVPEANSRGSISAGRRVILPALPPNSDQPRGSAGPPVFPAVAQGCTSQTLGDYERAASVSMNHWMLIGSGGRTRSRISEPGMAIATSRVNPRECRTTNSIAGIKS